MTWFKKRQLRLPLLIWGAQIPDGLSRGSYSSSQGRTQFIWGFAFMANRADPPLTLLAPKFFKCNTYGQPRNVLQTKDLLDT